MAMWRLINRRMRFCCCTKQGADRLERKAKRRRLRAEASMHLEMTWKRFDPSGVGFVAKSDLNLLLMDVGVSCIEDSEVGIRIIPTNAQGLVAKSDFLRWFSKSRCLRPLSIAGRLEAFFLSPLSAIGVRMEVKRAIKLHCRSTIKLWSEWCFDERDPPVCARFRCRLCSSHFTSFASWKNHKKACASRLAMEDSNPVVATFVYKLAKDLGITHGFFCWVERFEEWRIFCRRQKADRALARKQRRESRLSRRFRRSMAAKKKRLQVYEETLERRQKQKVEAQERRAKRLNASKSKE